MADISAEIAAFQSAVYGEDVRSAMVSLANKVNNESSAAAETVAGYDTRVSDLKSALNITDNALISATETTVNNIKTATKYTKNYINASHVLTYNASWQSYLIVVDDTESYEWFFAGYTNNDTLYAVGFYSNESPSDATYIDGIKYKDSTSKNSFLVSRRELPNGTKSILFCTRTATTQDETVEERIGGLKTIESFVNAISSKVDLHWGTPEEYNAELVVGGINSTNGNNDNSRTDRMRTDFLEVAKYGELVTMPTGVKCVVHGYSKTREWEGKYDSGNWIDSFAWSDLPSTFAYIRFAIDTGSLSTNIKLYERVYDNKALTEKVENKGSYDLQISPYSVGSLNQIARLGWDINNSHTPPEQSNDSYRVAYANGCRVMLCDVRVTQDGKYVLWHDDTLNNNVKHMDGTSLTAEELTTTIADSTLAELNVYDYGIYKGNKYAGMNIPTLDKFLNWCGLTNCIPMLEVKVQLTSSQCEEISNMIKMYGLGNRVIIDEYYTYLVNTVQYWIANLPDATICIINGTGITNALAIASQVISAGLKALITLSTTNQLAAIQNQYGSIDYDKVRNITNTGTGLTYTQITSEEELLDFYEDGYLSVFRFVSSSYVDINEWINRVLLSNQK